MKRHIFYKCSTDIDRVMCMVDAMSYFRICVLVFKMCSEKSILRHIFPNIFWYRLVSLSIKMHNNQPSQPKLNSLCVQHCCQSMLLYYYPRPFILRKIYIMGSPYLFRHFLNNFQFVIFIKHKRDVKLPYNNNIAQDEEKYNYV